MSAKRGVSVISLLAVLAMLFAFPLTAFAAGGVTHVVSATLQYGPNGWGGWSCPIGLVVIDAGIQNNDHGVAQALEWKPGATVGSYSYPTTPFGYTYAEGEEGYIVRNDNEGQSLQIWLDCAPPSEPAPAGSPWVHAYNLIKYRNDDPARPPELWNLFWIHVPPGFTAAWEPSVLANCNTGKFVPTAVDAVKNYECTKEMADAGLIKNLGVINVEVNVLTGQVRSNDPDWPTSAYNPHWFGQ